MARIEITPMDLGGSSKPQTNCVLALDCSGSMAASDYPPSRFEAAKKAARAFTTRKIIQGHCDRVGLIVFGGSAHIAQPLTEDLHLVEQAIDNVAGLTHTGTGIGEALRTASAMLTPGPRRAVVLLSDGENTAGSDPRAVMYWLSGIQVYTIGVGSPKGQEIDLPGLGRVRVRLDDKLLSDISKHTGGRYYYAPGLADLIGIFTDLADQ